MCTFIHVYICSAVRECTHLYMAVLTTHIQCILFTYIRLYVYIAVRGHAFVHPCINHTHKCTYVIVMISTEYGCTHGCTNHTHSTYIHTATGSGVCGTMRSTTSCCCLRDQTPAFFSPTYRRSHQTVAKVREDEGLGRFEIPALFICVEWLLLQVMRNVKNSMKRYVTRRGCEKRRRQSAH